MDQPQQPSERRDSDPLGALLDQEDVFDAMKAVVTFCLNGTVSGSLVPPIEAALPYVYQAGHSGVADGVFAPYNQDMGLAPRPSLVPGVSPSVPGASGPR